jgi:deazaflavin-dependent oxidoreductase (nitroreductase family)
MATTPGSAGAAAPARNRATKRPLLGLRRRPGRLALVVLRAPLPLYRAGFGRLLGHTFLLLTHLGRRTGTAHATTTMVLHHDRTTRESVVCAAWGPQADWVRNIRAHPAVQVQIARDCYRPQQRFLTTHEAFTVAAEFRRRHPWRLRLLTRVLGWGDLRSDVALRELVRTHPFVAFRPAA